LCIRKTGIDEKNKYNEEKNIFDVIMVKQVLSFFTSNFKLSYK